MGDKDDGLAGFFPYPQQLEVHFFPGQGIERAERFVHQYKFGVVDERARDGDTLFLNDGRYGTLTEFADIGAVERLRVPGKCAPLQAFTAFGPTCDSLDVLPAPLLLPGDVADGDYILFEGMGAYSSVLATPFNGFGAVKVVTLDS